MCVVCCCATLSPVQLPVFARMEPQQVATVQYLLGEGAKMCHLE